MQRHRLRLLGRARFSWLSKRGAGPLGIAFTALPAWAQDTPGQDLPQYGLSSQNIIVLLVLGLLVLLLPLLFACGVRVPVPIPPRVRRQDSHPESAEPAERMYTLAAAQFLRSDQRLLIHQGPESFIVFCWTAGLLCVLMAYSYQTGLLTGTDRDLFVTLAALGAFVFLVLAAIRLFCGGRVWILDRETDQLLCNGRVVCALGDITRLELVERPGGEGDRSFGVRMLCADRSPVVLLSERISTLRRADTEAFAREISGFLGVGMGPASRQKK